jgi:hypothetical protein
LGNKEKKRKSFPVKLSNCRSRNTPVTPLSDIAEQIWDALAGAVHGSNEPVNTSALFISA